MLDIDPGLLVYTPKPREGLIAAARDYIAFSDRYLKDEEGRGAFTVGERVRHSVFGFGIIEEVDSLKSAYIIQFEHMATPRSISFRVKLEGAS